MRGVRMGTAEQTSSAELFPGSKVDLGPRIGVEEQAAVALVHLVRGDSMMHGALVDAGGVPRLLSLIHNSSTIASEAALEALWHISTIAIHQPSMVRHKHAKPRHPRTHVGARSDGQ